MKKSLKYLGLLILPFGLIVSCEKAPDYPDTSQYKTVLTAIKIVNGGLSSTETIVGTVDEYNKRISFPEVHEDSDLSHVRFEIETTDDRAHLDSVEYNFVVPEGQSVRERTIKLVNNTRYREYYVKIGLDVPVWGADFTPSKVKVYDYSPATFKEGTYAAGSIDKPVYNAGVDYGRQYGISLNNVLIVDRVTNAPITNPGLVKLSDIKQGNIENFTALTGSATGWGSTGGVIKNGHVYICNGTPWGNELYINHWEEDKPDLAPQKMSYSWTAGVTKRYDGTLSGDIDANGTGYFFIHGNAGHGSVPANEMIVRYSVTDFSTLDKVDLLPVTTPYSGTWATFNKVPGTADEYLYSGFNSNNAKVRLMNSSAALQYEIPLWDETKAIGFAPTTGAVNIIVFNKERYLMAMDQVKGKFSVYDITLGATTQEALGLMKVTSPLFTYELGAVPPGNAAMTTAWVADGSDTLYLLAGGVQAGFAVFEIPKKVKEPQP